MVRLRLPWRRGDHRVNQDSEKVAVASRLAAAEADRCPAGDRCERVRDCRQARPRAGGRLAVRPDS